MVSGSCRSTYFKPAIVTAPDTNNRITITIDLVVGFVEVAAAREFYTKSILICTTQPGTGRVEGGAQRS